VAKVLILYHSIHGHVFKLAQAVAEGVVEAPGAEAIVKRVPEHLSREMLDSIGASEAQAAQVDIPVADPLELDQYDGIIIGTPTRYGNMTGQMRNFWDQTTPLWLEDGGLADQIAAAKGTSREEALEAARTKIPLGRFGREEEIAAAIVFLCSEPASNVVGAAWSVDGGSVPIIL
jgi:multimeric flavodoxin WrbA